MLWTRVTVFSKHLAETVHKRINLNPQMFHQQSVS